MRFNQIQKTAREAYKTLLEDSAFKYKSLQGRRLRAAAQQLMELADGEKEWVQTLKKEFYVWLKSPRRRSFKIIMGHNHTKYGTQGHRGYMYSYGIRVDKEPAKIYFSRELPGDRTTGD